MQHLQCRLLMHATHTNASSRDPPEKKGVLMRALTCARRARARPKLPLLCAHRHQGKEGATAQNGWQRGKSKGIGARPVHKN